MMLLVWLLICSQTLKAQEDVLLKLKSHRKVLVCGDESEKRIQVSLSIGQVDYNDSLYSFDIIIGYDTNKVRISNALTVNTLAEFFEYKGLGFVEPGFFRLYAAQMLGQPVSGNKPLIAFEAKYQSECSDTIEFYVDYAEIEVSQDLKNKLNFDSASIKIPVDVKETMNSFVTPYFLEDTVSQFEDDSIAKVVLYLNTNNLENVNFLKMVIDIPLNDNLVFNAVQYLNDKINFVKTYTEQDSGNLRLISYMELNDKINEESIMELSFKRLINRDDEITINAYLDSINTCTCATLLWSDSFVLKSQKDTTVSVVNEVERNDNKIDYIIVNDILNLENIDFADEIEIYNLNGKLMYKDNFRGDLIEVSEYAKGLYYLRIIKNNKILKKIVMIKN